jgi:cytochrome c556
MAVALTAILISDLAAAAIDLTDFDDDVMRAMDDSFKELEPVIGAGNAQVAKNDTEVLLEGYQWAEDYFTNKGGTEDAVKFARDGKALIAKAADALVRKDFETAAAVARETAKNCKSCHDLYKPLTK